LGISRATARVAYPSRPLTVIVPFSPGTSVGINARLLQPHFERALGESIELQFDQGAGGLAGHLLGAAAAADGYTLTFVSSSLTTQPWLSRASTATPDNFAFIGQVTSMPGVLLVRADSQVRTLAELVATLRASPESLTTGTITGWWPPAIALALFVARAAIKPRVVSSYYGGPELVIALAQGQLDFAVVGLADVGPSLNSGALRALAVTGHVQALPATQTFQALGWPITIGWWRGLAAPAATPTEVTSRLDAALREALDSASLHADFGRSGLPVDPLGAAEFRQLVLDEYQTTGALLSSLGLNINGRKPA
jgi:tripartite-type tricarboxylate transporter receptor subunit TctC